MSGRYIFYIILVIIFIAALFYAFTFFRQNTKDLTDLDFGGVKPAEIVAVPVPQPQVSFHKSSGANKLTVNWQNLPDSAGFLHIFRSPTEGQKGALWQKIGLSGPVGSAEFELTDQEVGTEYFYYAEATPLSDGDGDPVPVWSFPSVPAEDPASAPVSEPEASLLPEEPPISDISATTTPTTTPVATTESDSTTTPTESTTSPPVVPTLDYYTPELQLSTSTSLDPPVDHFGLIHRDNRINIWWYDLPPETTSFLVSRAESLNGPWLDLLRQSDPRSEDSMTILDMTLRADHYYRMEVFADELVIANYGPLLLPGLQE